MSEQTQLEARLLSAAELEVVNASRPPAIKQASDEQLKVLAQRLRRARDRAKDVAARQKREMRGKAHPWGAKPTRDNTGTLAKAQVLEEAIERVEEELSRLLATEVAPWAAAAGSRPSLPAGEVEFASDDPRGLGRQLADVLHASITGLAARGGA